MEQVQNKPCSQCMENGAGAKDLALGEPFLYDVADFFKVFGDVTRIKLLLWLLDGELCVTELAEKLQMSQSAVSHQLRVLRQNGLVCHRKEGKTVFYALDDRHVELVLCQGMSHIKHKKGYEKEPL